MSIREINIKGRPTSLKMFLCKPNTSRISPLKDVQEVSLSTKIGEINELSFSIPVRIERRKEKIDNPLIERLRHRYLVEVIFNSQKEYFVVLEDSKSYSDNGEEINFKLKSRAFLLADKTVKNYLEETKTLTQHINELISQTKWKIGYVDAEFDLMYRTYEAPSQTVLESVFGIVEKFKAIVFFDTIKLELNFYSPSKIGRNRGLKFKEGKYLESFNIDTSSLNTVTRLRVYGSEGMTFRNLSPTGSNYLEDFSLYMYPFEQDDDGNVIQSSYYMSDDLCKALENYTKVLANAQGEFDLILEDLSEAQDSLQKREQELSVLRTDMVQIVESIDVLNSAGESGSPHHAQKLLEKKNKEDELAAKESEISAIKTQLEGIEERRYDLQMNIRVEAHLTSANLLELDDFVIEKEYTNDSIVDEEDLLKDGIEEFKRLREPVVDISLNIENFLELIEFQNDWDKLRLGDVVTVESKILRTKIETRILEINYDKESNGITLRIANENELKDDYDKMVDEIYSSSSTSTVVNMDRYKWNLAEGASDGVSKILNSTWDATKQGIQAGYKQMLDITERGIFIRSPEDPKSLLVLQNGVLGLSNNGGDSWNLAITPQGVFAEQLVGRILLGNKLVIEDEDGIIQMTGSKQQIFDKNDNVKVTLGEYEPNKYGLQVNDGAINIRTSSNPNSGLKFNANGIEAYDTSGRKTFNLDSQTGKFSVTGALEMKTSFNSNRGVIIDGNGIRGFNNSGGKLFEINTSNGDAMFAGRLNGANGTFSGSLNAATGTFSGDLQAVRGTFSGTLQAVDGTFTTLSSGTISGATIRGSEILSNKSYNDGTYGSTSIKDANLTNQYELPNEEGFQRVEVEKGTMTVSFSDSFNTVDTIYSNSSIVSRENGSRGDFTINARTSFVGSVDFSNASVSGLSVTNAQYAMYADNADYATEANYAKFMQAYSGQRLEFGYSSTSNRVYIRIGGSVVGHMQLEN